MAKENAKQYANRLSKSEKTNGAIQKVSQEIEELSKDGHAHTNINQLSFFLNVLKHLKKVS